MRSIGTAGLFQNFHVLSGSVRRCLLASSGGKMHCQVKICPLVGLQSCSLLFVFVVTTLLCNSCCATAGAVTLGFLRKEEFDA